MNKWQQFTTLGWYDGLIEFLFRFVAKTSEPLLAAGLVISAADYLSHGAVMAGHSAFSMTWAWAQAAALESSSGVVFVYALQAFRQADKVKGAIYLALAVVLAIVGGGMLLLQVNAVTMGSSETAVPVLNILRVVVSIAYIFLLRAKSIRFSDLADVAETQGEQPVQPAPLPAPIDLAALLEQLDERYSQRMQAIVEQVVTRVQVNVTQDVPTQSARPSPTQERPANDEPICEDEEHESQPIYLDRFASKEHAIAALLAQKPETTAEEIAQEAGCNVRTAEKWRKKLVTQKGGAQPQRQHTTE